MTFSSKILRSTHRPKDQMVHPPVKQATSEKLNKLGRDHYFCYDGHMELLTSRFNITTALPWTLNVRAFKYLSSAAAFSFSCRGCFSRRKLTVSRWLSPKKSGPDFQIYKWALLKITLRGSPHSLLHPWIFELFHQTTKHTLGSSKLLSFSQHDQILDFHKLEKLRIPWIDPVF